MNFQRIWRKDQACAAAQSHLISCTGTPTLQPACTRSAWRSSSWRCGGRARASPVALPPSGESHTTPAVRCCAHRVLLQDVMTVLLYDWSLSNFPIGVGLTAVVLLMGWNVHSNARARGGPAGRWEARIGIPGSKHIYLGLHNDENGAARAYDSALVSASPLTASAPACHCLRMKHGSDEAFEVLPHLRRPTCKSAYKGSVALQSIQ